MAGQQTAAKGDGQWGLGHWNLYFLIKFLLLAQGVIQLQPLRNLALLALVALPARGRLWRVLQQLVAIPLGIALLYAESWLPPFKRVLSQASLLESFDLAYLAELVGRFINLDVLAVLLIVVVAYLYVSRYIRIGVLVTAALLYLALPPLSTWFGNASPRQQGVVVAQTGDAVTPVVTDPLQDMDRYLADFYAREAKRRVPMVPPGETDQPFDVLMIHVCSLSWDDLRFVGLDQELPAFDILFRNFNSAASYSGPAAIRVLRATCGQPPHKKLYEAAPAHCYLFDELQRAGFGKQLVLNHDGHFDDFIGVVQKAGRLNVPPMSTDGLPVPLRSFDGTPVYGDLATLGRWLSRRDSDAQARVATYYNTVTLHDGNRYTDGRAALSSSKTYKPRTKQLLSDLKRFFAQLERSGRRVLVVMVPEHGAAIRGDKLQISGLREIPSPAITKVPVGIRLIGPGIDHPLNPVVVDPPTSYLAISHIIAGLLAGDPFGPAGYHPAALVEDIPQTPFVAENADTVVVQRDGRYYIRLQEGADWSEYPVAEAGGERP